MRGNEHDPTGNARSRERSCPQHVQGYEMPSSKLVNKLIRAPAINGSALARRLCILSSKRSVRSSNTLSVLSEKEREERMKERETNDRHTGKYVGCTRLLTGCSFAGDVEGDGDGKKLRNLRNLKSNKSIITVTPTGDCECARI